MMKRIDTAKQKYMWIIDETDLISYSKIFIAPAIQSVVLVETRNTIGVALRDAAGQFFLIRERQAEWSREENEKIREDIRSFYDYIVADDRRIVVRLLAYGHTVNEFTGKDIWLPTLEYMCVDAETGASADGGTGSAADASRQEERDWLTYIREHCASEDCYGIYGAYGSAYWWWEEGQRVLHIMGSAAVNLPEDETGYYEEYAGSSRKIYMDQENSHPACIAICCGWDASITKLVIHEGIRIFSYVPLMNIGWNLSFEEVILPPTLREMPIMKCYADHVTIPESVSEIDLAAWYKSNVFCCDIDILYPASWDEGAETSFRDRVVSYVRSQKPMYGKMSGMDSEWFEWGEEEYRALWERVRTY